MPFSKNKRVCYSNWVMQTSPAHHLYITDIEAAINYWRLMGASHGHGLVQGGDKESTVADTLVGEEKYDASPHADNGWRLGSELRALAQVYGAMIYQRLLWLEVSAMPSLAYQAWLQWYASTPDTPCIAICSTSQGDAFCKGCGRAADEVRDWVSYSPAQKRVVWLRLQAEGTAWRFTRYLERSQAV